MLLLQHINRYDWQFWCYILIEIVRFCPLICLLAIENKSEIIIAIIMIIRTMMMFMVLCTAVAKVHLVYVFVNV